MAPIPRSMVSRAGFAAVGVVVVGFCAGDGSRSAMFLVRIVVVLLTAGLEVDDCWGPAAVDLRVEMLLLELVEVGTGVGGFVFEHLHESVEAGGEKRAEDGADPVYLSIRRVSVRCQLQGARVHTQ